jgi:hypothetical protein
MAGWTVENTLSDTQSLCSGVWGWVPEQYFDLNLLIDRAEREVRLYFLLFCFHSLTLLFFIYFCFVMLFCFVLCGYKYLHISQNFYPNETDRYFK